MSGLSAAAFAALMDALPNMPAGMLAVGVSGGADSLCLAICLKRWADKEGRQIQALMVDHRLGKGRAEKPLWVAAQLARYGIPLTVLPWRGKKPTNGIEEEARRARYRLLLQYCQREGIQALFIAHHAEDQVETFWMHLARGSGLVGLSGMKPAVLREGIWVLRPLLQIQKPVICQTLEALGQPWYEDPMNQDETFERVRWRKRQNFLSQNGLDIAAVSVAVRRLQGAESALAAYENAFWQAHVRVLPEGVAVLNRAAFDEQPAEMQMRLLRRALFLIGQPKTPVSLAAVERWVKTRPTRMTLSTCHVIQRRQQLFIAKEKARQEKGRLLKAFTATRWDRFLIVATEETRVFSAKPIPKRPDLPAAVQESFPAFSPDTRVIWDFSVDWTQKELEKQAKLYYNKEKIKSVYIRFIPEIKG